MSLHFLCIAYECFSWYVGTPWTWLIWPEPQNCTKTLTRVLNIANKQFYSNFVSKLDNLAISFLVGVLVDVSGWCFLLTADLSMQFLLFNGLMYYPFITDVVQINFMATSWPIAIGMQGITSICVTIYNPITLIVKLVQPTNPWSRAR